MISAPAVRAASTGSAPDVVERLVRSLSEWFGIESAVQDYVRAAGRMHTVLAWPAESSSEPENAVGVLLVDRHFPVSAEVHLMAVSRDWHRRGVGRALLTVAETALLRDGVRLLEVKTLGPSHPDAAFAATRAFYQAMGFVPVEESQAIWGAANPCLIMVKPLS